MASKPEDIKGEPHLIAHIFGKPGTGDELERYLKAVQVNAHNDTTEPGCFYYEVLRYGDKFVVVEHYKDVEAVNVHMASGPFQTFAKALDGLLEKPLELNFYGGV